jgi:UPF0716 protein FxsA
MHLAMPLFRALFLVFLIVPIIEIYLLIQVGEEIGAGWTIFLVVATAVAGAALLRYQGLATLYEAQNKMAHGELPASALLEGVMLLLAGALLLTPGFFTDALGFLFLIPMLRKRLAKALLHRGLMMGSSQFTARSWQHTSHPHRDDSKGKTIEGDYIRRDDD